MNTFAEFAAGFAGLLEEIYPLDWESHLVFEGSRVKKNEVAVCLIHSLYRFKFDLFLVEIRYGRPAGVCDGFPQKAVQRDQREAWKELRWKFKEIVGSFDALPASPEQCMMPWDDMVSRLNTYFDGAKTALENGTDIMITYPEMCSSPLQQLAWESFIMHFTLYPDGHLNYTTSGIFFSVKCSETTILCGSFLY